MGSGYQRVTGMPTDEHTVLYENELAHENENKYENVVSLEVIIDFNARIFDLQKLLIVISHGRTTYYRR